MEDLKYKNNLKSLQEQNHLVHELCQQIRLDFPNLNVVQLNVELINLICNKIEETVKSKQLKRVDKLEFFCLIYETLYNKAVLNENKKFLLSVIDYLNDNDLIITLNKYRRLGKLVKSLFFQKK